jgi:hypothetical protein
MYRPRRSEASALSAARELAVRSRRAQGLPDHVADIVTLDYVARLIAVISELPRAGVPP